jgi:ABC-type Mn2+/Zn2+ transport system permease subunit
VLLGLVTIAVVASFQAIGTLMVFGLLVAPAAAASLLTRTMPSMMAGAAAIGSGATVVGLLVSYHADLAAGASISATAVVVFLVVFAAREALDALTRRTAPT